MTDRTARGRADSPRPRTAARLAAVQALYQIEMSELPPIRVIEEFVAHRLSGQEAASGDAAEGESDDVGYGPADVGHFRRVVDGAARDREAVDGLMSAHLPPEWPIGRLDSTVRALLRAGAWELLGCGDVPAAVAISEYVDISRAFHGERAPALVNGVLDAIARKVREGELGARTGRGGR